MDQDIGKIGMGAIMDPSFMLFMANAPLKIVTFIIYQGTRDHVVPSWFVSWLLQNFYKKEDKTQSCTLYIRAIYVMYGTLIYGWITQSSSTVDSVRLKSRFATTLLLVNESIRFVYKRTSCIRRYRHNTDWSLPK
jgi:hypothetical protein